MTDYQPGKTFADWVMKSKEESLDKKVGRVRTAYWEKFGRGDGEVAPASSVVGWIEEVFDDHVIVCKKDKYFKMPYSFDAQGNVVFDTENVKRVEKIWQEIA